MEDFGKLAAYRRNRQIKIIDKLKFIDIAKKKGNGEAERILQNPYYIRDKTKYNLNN